MTGAASEETTGEPSGGGVPRRGRRRRSSLQQLRDKITCEALLTEIEELLEASGRGITEWEQWPPVLAQVRISSADTRWRTASESPHNQLRTVARYCVRHRFRPVALCFEAQSASRTDAKPRPLFERYYRQIADGGLQVTAVVTYNTDRFTRNRYVGERWLRMLKAHGIDLHETDKMQPPRPLAQVEPQIVKALHGAAHEAKRMSKRTRDANASREDADQLLHSADHYGHRTVYEERNGRRVPTGAVIVHAEAEVIREATRRLQADEPLGRICRDFNERGLTGRYGGRWANSSLKKILTSPRIAGQQRAHDGRLLVKNIAPIVSEKEWARNCELLAPQRTNAPARDTLLARPMRVCGVCGATMVLRAGTRSGLRCSRAKRLCECGGGDLGRSCRCSGPEAVRHGSFPLQQLERFVLEAAQLAAETAGEEPGEERDRQTRQRSLLQTKLARCEVERRELARAQRRGEVTFERAEDQLRRLARRGADLRERLTELDRDQPIGHDLLHLSRLAGRGHERDRQRALVSHVIARCLIHPWEPGRQRDYGRITIIFRPGYEPPIEAMTALRRRLNAEWLREWHRVHASPPAGSSPEDRREAWTLHEQGRSSAEIADMFTLRRRRPPNAPPSRRPAWTVRGIDGMLRWEAAERGQELSTPTASRSRFPYEARALIYELVGGADRPLSAIAEDLQQMRIRHPEVRDWTGADVERAYREECERRGEAADL